MNQADVTAAQPHGDVAGPGWQPSPNVRLLLALVPCVVGIFVAIQYFSFMLAVASPVPPFTDALWYQAAGERLNAGHLLYALSPGDRPVFLVPGISAAPLLSPPPIAVFWRVVVALPIGFSLWVVGCWIALLATTGYLVFRTGVRGAIVATVLSPAIGEQLAACNVAAFFPALFVLAWRWRDRPIAGVIVGVTTSLKLTPGTLGGWLIATRRWPAISAAACTVAVVILVTVVGSGVGSFADYAHVATAAGSSTSSLSGLTGIGWASPLALVVGTIAIALLGRWPRVAFISAVLLSVAGSPSLYLSGWVAALAVLAPFSETHRRVAR